MPSVPYTFSTQTGNIPLSELDANFNALATAVPLYANTAGTVTSNVQANITQIGTLTELQVTGNIYSNTVVIAPSVVTNFISSDDSTAVVVNDDVTLNGDLDITGGLRVFGAPFRLPSFTSDQIANIVAVNGDMVYNTTLNKFQGYENGGWANII